MSEISTQSAIYLEQFNRTCTDMYMTMEKVCCEELNQTGVQITRECEKELTVRVHGRVIKIDPKITENENFPHVGQMTPGYEFVFKSNCILAAKYQITAQAWQDLESGCNIRCGNTFNAMAAMEKACRDSIESQIVNASYLPFLDGFAHNYYNTGAGTTNLVYQTPASAGRVGLLGIDGNPFFGWHVDPIPGSFPWRNQALNNEPFSEQALHTAMQHGQNGFYDINGEQSCPRIYDELIVVNGSEAHAMVCRILSLEKDVVPTTVGQIPYARVHSCVYGGIAKVRVLCSSKIQNKEAWFMRDSGYWSRMTNQMSCEGREPITSSFRVNISNPVKNLNECSPCGYGIDNDNGSRHRLYMATIGFGSVGMGEEFYASNGSGNPI